VSANKGKGSELKPHYHQKKKKKKKVGSKQGLKCTRLLAEHILQGYGLACARGFTYKPSFNVAFQNTMGLLKADCI
jgi:hypothetical protein